MGYNYFLFYISFIEKIMMDNISVKQDLNYGKFIIFIWKKS